MKPEKRISAEDALQHPWFSEELLEWPYLWVLGVYLLVTL